MNLLGIDVGFGAGKTTGVATLTAAGLSVGRIGTSRLERTAWGQLARWDVLAVDGPIVPVGTGIAQLRTCERALAAARFQRRCKPGMSHVPGTGQAFRAAAGETAEHLKGDVNSGDVSSPFPRVLPPANVVEAFPNAYLGVALDDGCYEEMPRLRRGRKFDWLYDQWCASNLFVDVSHTIGVPEAVPQACRCNRDHEERAALVCLLTAASVFSGRYVAIGDAVGGYLFLPPWSHWADWARASINQNRRRYACCDTWISGRLLTANDELPGS